jgi:hypothetical protein
VTSAPTGAEAPLFSHAEYDRHLCGLFGREDWLRLLGSVGFLPRVVPDSYGRDVFVAVRPGDWSEPAA